MTTTEAWDYAIGMVKMAGLEPTEEFIRYIEKEKSGGDLERCCCLCDRLYGGVSCRFSCNQPAV